MERVLHTPATSINKGDHGQVSTRRFKRSDLTIIGIIIVNHDINKGVVRTEAIDGLVPATICY